MSFLAGQRILLVAPLFFGYERDIKDELQRQGAVVDWLQDRPFNTPVMTALTKLRADWILPFADGLYEQKLDEFGATHYDIVLIINGQTMSQRTLQRIRTAFPSARYILYMWDSFANRDRFRDRLSQFDRVCTFDPEDAARYGIPLRPLFYGRGFEAPPVPMPTRYHISFIGTAHTDRFAVVDRLRANLPKGTSTFWYLYLQAKWVKYYYQLTQPQLRHARAKDFNFVPLDKETVQSVFAESHCILDIEHPLQVGLTMRTFETLGAQKKLVTTNASVRGYDFFSPENICVIDRENPRIPESFLDSPFNPLKAAVQKRYSISGWLAELLDLQYE